MPASFEDHTASLKKDLTNISLSPKTPASSTLVKERGTRVLIQVYESHIPLGSSAESGSCSGVLSTFIESGLTLAQLRLMLPELASKHGDPWKLSDRGWTFYYGIQSPINNLPVFYNVPKTQEAEEFALDFAPVLVIQLAAKSKSPQQKQKDDSQGFELVDRASTDCCGKNTTEKVVILHPRSNQCSEKLCSQLKQSLRNESALYDAEPNLPVYKLFAVLQSLKKHAASSPPMKMLVEVVEELQKDEIVKMDHLKAEGNVTFQYLEHLFTIGSKVVTARKGIEDMLVGGEVESTRYVQTWCGRYFEVMYKVIKSSGKRFYVDKERAVIHSFSGTKAISQLPIRILTASTEATLTARGRKFNLYGLGSHYLHYGNGGNIIKETWCGPQLTRAQGRIMVDVVTFEKINPNSRYAHAQDSEVDVPLQLKEDMLYMCYPTLLGFSFAAKRWGEVDLDKVEEIEFDAGAFDALVLDQDKKCLIQSLVTNYQTSFSDVISGKGGGCIFLLHGQPGTGKTLTAEAIAELLRRPLYSVSVGELGTDTTTLEASLRQILEVASVWNAVVLLDEADIFLEKRTEHDVARNAMVGVFLRLLEYHQGVLFLTTNRVKSFDSAFHSRISVALRYHDLDKTQRRQVWTTLLAAAGITQLDVDALSEHELNGRQIKTTIRLAQALALQEGGKVLPCHVEQTVLIARQFCQDLATASSW